MTAGKPCVASARLPAKTSILAAKAGVEDLPAPKRVVYTTPGPEDTAVSSLKTNKVDYVGQSVPTVAGFIAAKKENPNLINWDGDLGWVDASRTMIDNRRCPRPACRSR